MRKRKRENRSQQAVTMAIVVLIAFFVLTGTSLSERDSKNNKVSDGFDAYKVIVTNNLFRPLGWTEKKSGPSYRLIGTAIRDDGNGKALILDENTKQTYYVAVGDKIGNATVEKITSKNVALRQPNSFREAESRTEAGGLLELNLGPMQFLNVPKKDTYRVGQLKAHTATQASKSGEPLSRTHQIGGETHTFGHPVSREEANRLIDEFHDRTRRMQERMARYRSQGRL